MMHKMHNESNGGNALATTGATIHWSSQYDLFARLLGLGVNGKNSRMVIDMAGIKTGDKVLDVGCGTGDLTLAAAIAAGASGSACGIDAAPEGIQIAQKKAGLSRISAEFKVGLAEKISYPDACFNFAISRRVIHHLPDDLKRKGFADVYRVLKPGGHIYMVDFKPPRGPVLRHLTTALLGHRMMAESRVWEVPRLLEEAGCVEVESGATRSALMAFVSGMKPAA